MDIFVSFSRKNQAGANLLAQDLQQLGHNVWVDQELTGGQNWWERILLEIRRCDVFVFVLAAEALRSVACQREWGYAAQLNKRILPVLVADGVSTNLLPSALSVIQFVDYRHQDKQAFAALYKAIQNLPPAQPLPAPLPTPPEVPLSYLNSIRDQIDKQGLPPGLEGQRAIVNQLKDGLGGQDEREDALRLLQDLRNQPNLLARVAAEIDVVLGNKTGSFPRAKRDAGPTRNAGGTKPIEAPRSSSSPIPNGTSTTSNVGPKPASPARMVRLAVAAVVGLCGVFAVATSSYSEIMIVIGGVFLLAAFLIVKSG